MDNVAAFRNDLMDLLKKHGIENFVYALSQNLPLKPINEMTNDEVIEILKRRNDNLPDHKILQHAGIMGDEKAVLNAFSYFLDKNEHLICLLNDCHDCDGMEEDGCCHEEESGDDGCKEDSPSDQVNCDCCGEKIQNSELFKIVKLSSVHPLFKLRESLHRDMSKVKISDKHISALFSKRPGK